MDNKYYTAEILLQSGCFDETGKVNAKFDNYEAVVIIFDSIQKLNVSRGLVQDSLTSCSTYRSVTH